MASKRRTRHGIGEWYGKGFEFYSPDERISFAERELNTDGLTHTICPFQSADAQCNKKGGVCSLRLYEQEEKGPVNGVGSLITTCPNRFQEDGLIYRWVARTLLDTEDPVILSEIGFLDRLKDNQDKGDDAQIIGRIDNVLLHPTKRPLDWCALEIQAVYFSGKSMTQEFKMLSSYNKKNLPFPAAHRRPDWRSSGPKRLLPQLQTKTPTIRTWGKKVAVVIDEPFFGSLIGLEREKHASNAEIVWFIVGYDQTQNGWKLVERDVIYTKLESSIRALTGGVPLSKEGFEEQLLNKLKNIDSNHTLLSEES
jgi:hypothetical protein